MFLHCGSGSLLFAYVLNEGENVKESFLFGGELGRDGVYFLGVFHGLKYTSLYIAGARAVCQMYGTEDPH
jgi:hypothetical protein